MCSRATDFCCNGCNIAIALVDKQKGEQTACAMAWLRKLSRRLSRPGFPRYGITSCLPLAGKQRRLELDFERTEKSGRVAHILTRVILEQPWAPQSFFTARR